MGTKMTLSYANHFMGKLEKLIILSAPHKPLSWFRYIDDVDMKWTESEENLNRFFDHANYAHKASGIDRKNLIQYKEKKTNNRVPFVITYHPVLSNLSNIVRKHWTTIQKHP